MGDLDASWARAWMQACVDVIGEQRGALNQLDREIGDGDHGENMERGFLAVGARLAETATDTPAEVFRLAATTLMATVGGAAGPLYGTAFLRAAKAAGTQDLSPDAFAAVLQAATEGIIARGKAEPQDKTMVDAWLPAARAAQERAEEGDAPAAVVQAAADAAAQGARDTEPWIARKGRASYLGERSRGHRDPGAQSSALLLGAAAEVAGRENG